jgi:predicted dehydrogenase
MNLTSEQKELGRRNFLKALAGTPALAALGAGALVKGPIKGGPVRIAWIGVGAQGRGLLGHSDPAFCDVKALCDINPASLAAADKLLADRKRPPAKHYTEWKDMLQKEDIEAVVIAVPLWAHAEVAAGCLEAGKHVLCEKMMAYDDAGIQRMLDARNKSGRILEIGYHRNYSTMYTAAYDGVVKAGLLGDVYHARLVWHRNGNWRRKGEPPSPDYDPSRWGYPDFEHLLNWRLYWRYSRGLMAELASHQVNVTNWFFGAVPESVQASGGVYRFKEGGREAYDHVYAIFDYPGGRTVTFSSVESNAFEGHYEIFMGTKGTLILADESDAYFFEEGKGAKSTAIETTPKGTAPVLDASESKSTETQRSTVQGLVKAGSAYANEVAGFCSSVRTGKPVACGPERAMHSARACTLANEAAEKGQRLRLA